MLPGAALQSEDRLAKTDFDIDLDAEEVTCPAGHTTQKFYLVRDGKDRRVRSYRFPARTCNACALKAACTSSPRGRSITLHYNEKALRAAHAYNQSEEFKTKYRRRALVERKLSELLFRHGLRFGRYVGRQKIRLQALWTALVANLKRLAKLVKKDGKTLEEALIRVKA